MVVTVERRAAELNIEIEKGSTVDQLLTWRDKSTGDPIDITGYSARMKVRDSAKSLGIPLLDITDILSTDGQVVLGGVAGTIRIQIPYTITEAWEFVDAVYDLELIDSDGNVRRFIEGTFKGLDEVTRIDT